MHDAPAWSSRQHSLDQYMIIAFIYIKTVSFHLLDGLFSNLVVLIMDFLPFFEYFKCFI